MLIDGAGSLLSHGAVGACICTPLIPVVATTSAMAPALLLSVLASYAPEFPG